MTTRPIYVIGHKNPDADSICSAIAYADFKQQQGQKQFVAARCGNSNSRIDAILKEFNVPLPTFIGDVSPRLRDIMVQDIKKLTIDATCSDALQIIDAHDIRALPVVDTQNKLEGYISIFQLGEHFMPKPGNVQDLRRVRTNIRCIIDSLEAKTLNVVNEDSVEELYVRVGAMDVRSFGKFSGESEVDVSKAVIICGDRWDIQEKSIQMGVKLLVITGGLAVDDDIIANARANGVNLIVSPFDSASTAWIIRTATRIEPLVQREFLTFKPDEKLRQVKRKVAQTNLPVYPVVDENNILQGIFTKTEFLKPIPTELVLVDHNELGQAVTGAQEVNIREIIDHHRLGSLNTEQPILFINQPVGSTCTIIADLYRKSGIDPSPEMAGIMMSGLISDTLNLHSPTTTETDRSILDWLKTIAQVEPDALSELIFSSGSVILSNPPERVIRTDQKFYSQEDIRYSVSQVEELGFSNFWKHHDALKDALREHADQENLLFSSLLITDINTQNSLLLIEGNLEVRDAINYNKVEEQDVFDLPGIVSRKKQLIPYFTNILKGFQNPA